MAGALRRFASLLAAVCALSTASAHAAPSKHRAGRGAAGPARRPATRKPAAKAPAAKRPAPERAAKRRRRRPRARTPRGYAAQVRGWHARDPKREAPLDAAGRPALVLEILNTGERFVLPVVSAEGRFSAETLDLAAHALRDQRSNREFPVDPEVLATLYRLQLHFQAHSLRVVSAYRAARPGGHSRHGQGRAVDLVVPGATDREVAAFARGLGYSGVGVYLVSGFVHVDVRPRSYAWVDLSGPGQPNRARSAGGKELAEADARARAAGRAAPRDAVTPTSDIEAALAGARGEASGPPHDEPDRDDSDDSDDSDAELDAASGAGE